MPLYHNNRPIKGEAVDYGDGLVMIMYVDNGEVSIVPKANIKTEKE
jgi:hypothetical protein